MNSKLVAAENFYINVMLNVVLHFSCQKIFVRAPLVAPARRDESFVLEQFRMFSNRRISSLLFLSCVKGSIVRSSYGGEIAI